LSKPKQTLRAESTNPAWPTPHVHNIDCSTMVGADDDDFVAWCQAYHPTLTTVKDSESMLTGMMRECAWQEYAEGELAMKLTVRHAGFAEDTVVAGPQYEFVHGKTQAHCESADWQFNRIGPITTNGGYDWTSWVGHLQTPGDGELQYLSGYYVGNVHASNYSIIGYPPLHQHHSHIHCNHTDDNSHEAIIHGDEQCLESLGGAGCTIRLFPPGNSMRMYRPIGGNAEVNDVRVAGSEDLTTYFIVALRMSTAQASPRPVQMFGVAGMEPYLKMRPGFGYTKHTPDGGPYQMDGVTPQPPFAFLNHAFFATDIVPGDTLSAMWEEQTVMSPWKLRWGWFHTHQQWAEAIYVYLNVSAKELGISDLLPQKWLLHIDGNPGDLPNSVGTGGANVSKVSDLLESQRHHVPMCRWVREEAPYDVHTDTMELGKQFHRTQSACRPVSALPGMPLTFVAIYSPMEEGIARGNGTVHTTVRVVTETDTYDTHPESAVVGARRGIPDLVWWRGGPPEDEAAWLQYVVPKDQWPQDPPPRPYA